MQKNLDINYKIKKRYLKEELHKLEGFSVAMSLEGEGERGHGDRLGVELEARRLGRLHFNRILIFQINLNI